MEIYSTYIGLRPYINYPRSLGSYRSVNDPTDPTDPSRDLRFSCANGALAEPYSPLVTWVVTFSKKTF